MEYGGLDMVNTSWRGVPLPVFPGIAADSRIDKAGLFVEDLRDLGI